MGIGRGHYKWLVGIHKSARVQRPNQNSNWSGQEPQRAEPGDHGQWQALAGGNCRGHPERKAGNLSCACVCVCVFSFACALVAKTTNKPISQLTNQQANRPKQNRAQQRSKHESQKAETYKERKE